MSPFRTLLSMLAHHKGILTVAVIMSLVGSALGLVQPLVINRIISTIGEGPIAWLVWLLVGLLLVSSVLSALRSYLLTRTAESAVLSTRHRLIARLLRLPIPAYDRHRTGDLVTEPLDDRVAVLTPPAAPRPPGPAPQPGVTSHGPAGPRAPGWGAPGAHT